jgi:hypothetical protein
MALYFWSCAISVYDLIRSHNRQSLATEPEELQSPIFVERRIVQKLEEQMT